MKKYNPTLEQNFIEWSDDAPCKGMLDLFFSDKRNEITQAIAICNTCPYQKQCDEYATVNKIEHGVWGGTMRNKGVRLRASRNAAKKAIEQVVEVQAIDSNNDDIA